MLNKTGTLSSKLPPLQLSGGEPVKTTPIDPTLSSRLQESEGQVKQLKRNLESLKREKDQVSSDLSILQDSMVQQREESTREVRNKVVLL